MTTDLELAYKTLTTKAAVHDRFFRYYDGDQPTVYLTERLREIFRGVDEVFTENWCAVVIDSMLERINYTGFTLTDKTLEDTLKSLLEENEFGLELDDAHSGALVTGEAYFIIWKANEEEPITLDYNDSRWTHLFYHGGNPKKPRFAAKGWTDDSGSARLTLYYEDRLEYYSAKKGWSDISSARTFQPDPELFVDGTWPANPYSRVPVFLLKTSRYPKSELKSVIPVQNGVNKLLSDMMVAAEYGAFKQRWVISNSDVQGKIKSAPGEIWDLPAGDSETGGQTQVGEFSSTELSNYLNAISSLSMAIGITTRTPRHYFYNSGGDPSGEALIAMEAPLNKKVTDRIDRFKPSLKHMLSFIAELMGIDLPVSQITINYEKPESIQPKTQADITKVRIDSGVPLESALKWEGKSDQEVAEVMKVKKTADQQAQKSLAEALLNAQEARNTDNANAGDNNPADQGNNPQTPPQAPTQG